MSCSYIVPMHEVIGDVVRTLADHFNSHLPSSLTCCEAMHSLGTD